jgi:hypothetical protein
LLALVGLSWKPPQVLSAVIILDCTNKILRMRRAGREVDLTALENHHIGVITAKVIQSPATWVLRHAANEVFFIRITQKNGSMGAIFEFLNRLPDEIRAVFQIKDSLTPNLIKLNAADIVELLDEMVDSGYPQNTNAKSFGLLTSGRPHRLGSGPFCGGRRTSAINGMRSSSMWSSARVTHGQNPRLLGQCNIIMNVHFLGMPECKIEVNNKVTVELDGIGGSDALIYPEVIPVGPTARMIEHNLVSFLMEKVEKARQLLWIFFLRLIGPRFAIQQTVRDPSSDS